MGVLKFTNTMLYVLGMLISNSLIEGATINERTQVCCPADGMCILPPYPDHGQYNASTGLKPGDAVRNITLTFSCDLGYRLNGKSSPECVNGTWLAELPTCTNQCKPLKSNSVDFKCYEQNSTKEISCTLPQDHNSHAKATCKDSYYLDPAPKDLSCINGSWNYMPYCNLECGTVAPVGQTLVINGTEAKIYEFPWHVGLYLKNWTPITQICGGSIFTPKLVITAAHCVHKYQAVKYPGIPLAVAAGKLYRGWDSSRDDEKYVQKIDVMKIEIPERYKGLSNAYMADIAVLVLERSFILSSLVRPVCIAFDSEQHLDGKFGRVAGWGLTAEEGKASRILQTVRLPYVSFKECYDSSKESFQSLLTDDKICAGYKNGTALCQGDSGGGLVFSGQNSNLNLYFLHGIVSVSPRNEKQTSCSALAYTGFTNTFKHQKWLEDICLLEWGCENGGCISLEQRCHGGNTYCLGRSDETGFCSTSNVSTSKDLCVLPEYPRHGNYHATKGLQPGDAVSHTSLKYTCEVGYRLKGEDSPSCIRGSWAAEVPTCEKFHENHKPCGMVSSQSGESVFERRITINGTDVKFLAIPWIVRLFREENGRSQCALTDTDCWRNFADGSLISSKFVLTTAHLIYSHRDSKLKAHAGDLTVFHEPYQERFVTKTAIHPDYKGTTGGYNVALVVVDPPYTSADNIGFICLPPPNLNMTPASCKVAIFSSTEGAVGEEILHVVDLNTMNHDQCQKIYAKNTPTLVLHDSSLCTGAVQINDTFQVAPGSPLMCFAADNYYARSVVSWYIPEYEEEISLVYYTDVVKVRNWIDAEVNANGFTTDTYTHVTHRNSTTTK